MPNARINYTKVTPEPFQHLVEIKKWLDAADIDQRLRSLLDVRISQINGCAFCLDIHGREAREHGVTQQQLDVLTSTARRSNGRSRSRSSRNAAPATKTSTRSANT